MASKREEARWQLRKDQLRFYGAIAVNAFVLVMYFVVAPFWKALAGTALDLPDVRLVLTVTVGLGAPAIAVNPAKFRRIAQRVLDAMDDDAAAGDGEGAGDATQG